MVFYRFTNYSPTTFFVCVCFVLFAIVRLVLDIFIFFNLNYNDFQS